jgi:predicted flap endonuclease-1-like 5' DNA nuclease
MAISNSPIHDLPGLSETHAQALANLGFTTTEHLYRYGQSSSHRQALAKNLAVPSRYVTKWMVLAELARIPSVGCTFNGLLLHSGIMSVAQLAESSTQTLYTQIRRLQVKTLQRSDLCPTPDQVSGWIHQAKQLNAQNRRRMGEK